MFGSENVKNIKLDIDADPGATDKYFYLLKAPREITVLAAHMVSRQTQNAGTAVKLRIENWGTAGTTVGGTVCAYVGGTATASVLTANTPAAATIDTARDNVTAGQWLVAHYAEEGVGWISGDYFSLHIQYVDGLGA